MNPVVVARVASTPRGYAGRGAGRARGGDLRCRAGTVVARLDDAIEAAVGAGRRVGGWAPGVLITGSVVVVGEARTLLGGADRRALPESDLDDDWDPTPPTTATTIGRPRGVAVN